MINPILFHIYGPLSVHWYGFMIALGLLVYIFFTERLFIRYKLLNSTEFQTLVITGIVAGVVGGKFIHIVSEWSIYSSWWEIVQFFEGGFSILGTVIAVALATTCLLWYWNKPVLPVLDIAAVYAPLTQAFGRVGCFLAGCCFGCPSSLPFAVTYTHPQSLAPLYVALHPAQLYSASALFIIFCMMVAVSKKFLRTPGLMTGTYLVALATERFFIDFWRADRIFLQHISFVSWHQLLALSLFIIGCGIIVSSLKRRTYEHI